VKNVFSPDSLGSYRVSQALLGAYVDPIFGKTSAEFVTEFRPSYVVSFDDDLLQVDSFKLFLAYTDTTTEGSFYGSYTNEIEFSIYELTQVLDTILYPSGFDMTGLYDENPLLDYSLNLVPDTSFLEIMLPNSLGEKILDLDSLEMISFTEFKKKLPGLYFKINSDIDAGITRFDFSLFDTRMVLYYSKPDSNFQAAFSMDQYCVNMNLFSHEYEGSEIEQNVLSSSDENQEIYMQSMNGVRAIIEIVNPSILYQKTINLAELVVPILQESDYINYPPVNDLILLSVDMDGNLRYISEYPSFGEFFNEETLEYKFNITRYIQTIANQADSIQPKLYITSTYSRVDYSRVVLDNRDNAIKLKLNYINEK
ncbi:MAG: DUF4270 family protein, partial [Bacteroidales bacterium]|nr:DUF4270 family protein [Bacteroidales bacterium]